MVLKRKLDYGPHSTLFPVIPRGPRSVRRRVSSKDSIEDTSLSAFELLAAVAGKLLQESESSASSNAAVEEDPLFSKLSQESESDSGKGKEKVVKALAPEYPDRGSCVVTGLPADRGDLKSVTRKLIPNECDTVLETESVISASNMYKDDGDKVKLECLDKIVCVKHEGGSLNCGESSVGYVDNSIVGQLEANGGSFNRNADFTDTDTPKDKLKINVNYYPPTKTGSSVQLTSFRDSVPSHSVLRRRKNVNVSSRDDDENFFRCSRCKPKSRAFRPQSYIGYRRIRTSTSKYWKVAPKLRDCEFFSSERGMKRIFYNQKLCHASERIRQKGPFKKSKPFDGSSGRASDREGSSESISNTPEKYIKGKKIRSAMKSRKVRGKLSAFAGQRPSYQSMGSHVKFSIKSFKVPELYIEVPETTTVGSLKRTVMDAVTAILQEGLGVGVLLQGENVKDDERTLIQTGISQNGNLENLGFSLEPTSVIAPPPVSPEVSLALLPCETAQQLTRIVTGTVVESGLSTLSADPLQVPNMDCNATSNYELVPFPTEHVTNGEEPESRSIVPVPAASIEGLCMVPMSQKAKRNELAQRRTRRPFSVTEVEALVEAVETLGTGRWRDVKLQAFEDADHRTYVDLKDKWKTLVHTASISPQQRRGQPVPQELLDRVLGAHAYWSQHQSKQQSNKNQSLN